ncbi:MAG: methionyl-tRNA formyltransferase [Betaproteobacteria bacterium]|nr:methionyl-tRNA formyltransferase [Betaproteobacteria bacterium]
MKLIFCGTPEFAARSLDAILEAGHEVLLVLTQPDRPAGRGMASQASPVKRLAEQRGLQVAQPPRLKISVAQTPQMQAQIRDTLEILRSKAADAMIVAAYGLILPQEILDLPRHGCLNIHASLLPRWRGAAPIQRALLAGDAKTGVCIMQMDAGLDTGGILTCQETPIASDDTAQSLHDRLTAQGAALMVDTLARLPLPATPQPEEGASYAGKIEKSEARLDWRHFAVELDRRVRAFNPAPGAVAEFDGLMMKVWRAVPLEAPSSGVPGEVLAADKSGILVACGDGALRIEELQKPGGKRLTAAQFLAGHKCAPGMRFA